MSNIPLILALKLARTRYHDNTPRFQSLMKEGMLQNSKIFENNDFFFSCDGKDEFLTAITPDLSVT